MSISIAALVGALFLIAILWIIINAILKVSPLSHPLPIIVWAAFAIISLLALAWALGVPIPGISLR